MNQPTPYTIAVFPGDGIGPEVMQPCLDIIHTACELAGAAGVKTDHVEAGAVTYQQTGSALPDSALATAKQADAILLAAMGDPAIRYPDGTEITPQLNLRFELGLFAGIRPVRSIPGVKGPLRDPRADALDIVLVRESIEGLFAPEAKGEQFEDSSATETLLITRDVSERLFSKAFQLNAARQKAGRGRNRVTCVDKANVFAAFAFFRKIFDEVAASHTTAQTDYAYVDATALKLMTHPWEFDVMVTENMFGDILSDQAAALVGGMGYAPSADIGDEHAVFQPCHGSAPDIVGQGLANPTAMILSGAMMLDWLGEKHADAAAKNAGQLIVQAVDNAFAPGKLKTCELGGQSGLDDVGKAIKKALTELKI